MQTPKYQNRKLIKIPVMAFCFSLPPSCILRPHANSCAGVGLLIRQRLAQAKAREFGANVENEKLQHFQDVRISCGSYDVREEGGAKAHERREEGGGRGWGDREGERRRPRFGNREGGWERLGEGRRDSLWGGGVGSESWTKTGGINLGDDVQ